MKGIAYFMVLCACCACRYGNTAAEEALIAGGAFYKMGSHEEIRGAIIGTDGSWGNNPERMNESSHTKKDGKCGGKTAT